MEHDVRPAPGEPRPEEPRGRPPGLELLHAVTPRAWATPSITAVLVLCFAASALRGVDAVSPRAGQLLEAGGDFGPALLDGQWWRLLTSAFLHAGVMHLAFNVWAFWNVGRLAERIFGNAAFLALYLLSAIGASLVSIAVHPLTIGVGASGAIFGVYGALLTFALTHRGGISPEVLRQQRNSLLAFFAYNLVFALSQPHVDLAGHVGGFLTGMAAGWLLRRDLRAPAAHAGRRARGALALVAALVVAAVAVRERVARIPEARAWHLARAAVEAHDAKRYDAAVALYTQCLEAKGDDLCLFNRGLVHEVLGHRDAALADLRGAVKANDSARRRMALCAAAADFVGDDASIDAAIADCTRALELDPASRDALHERAILHARRHGFGAALADATREVELGGDDWYARALRGSVLRSLKRFDEAEQECSVLWKRPAQPERSFPAYCSAIARTRGDAGVALERANRRLAEKPDDVETLQRRSSLLHEAGDLAGAIADLDRVLRLKPDLAGALNDRGWYRVLRGDLAGGLEDAERSLALHPDDADTLGTRCFALAGLGRRAEARRDCARAAALQPADLVDRGMLALLDGRRAEAVRLWGEAARQRPAHGRDLAPWVAEAARR